MRFGRAILATLFLSMLLFSLGAPTVSAAPIANGMTIETDMTISGVVDLKTTGSVKMTFSGDSAVLLRQKILSTYDGDSNQFLDATETVNFLMGVSSHLVGKIYWGMSIGSATNFSGKSETYLIENTGGLVNYNWTRTESISFKVGFEGKGDDEARVIETARGAYDAFATALDEATGYRFSGNFSVSQKVTTFGLGSFTNPVLDSGKISAFRNPLGEMLWYSFTGTTTSTEPSHDSITYRSFSAVENQQIAFVVLIIGLILILRMPGTKFDKFEKLHPRKFRKYAKPLASVRICSFVLAAVLAALYFLPFAFSFVSKEALLYSAYLYILIPVALIGEHFFSKEMYDRAIESIPDEKVIEVKQAIVEPKEGEGEMLCKVCYRSIEAGLDLFQCNCGATMHVDCAEKAQNCPACGEPLFPQRTRSIQCKACGETFIYSGLEDPYSIQCTKCGAFQEEIKAGRNYIVAASDPHNAFMMIRAMHLSGKPTLCLTTSFPGKIRSDYDLGEMDIKWLSDSTTDIDNVNPKDLEGDSMEIVSTFLMTTKGSGVMLDGVDQLISINGFDKVLAFVKKLNDLAKTHGSTIVLSVNKQGLPEDQYKRLSDSFDEIHDYQ